MSCPARLEEMPAEEGYPAYLASRLSAFYERAGMTQNLNGTEGSVLHYRSRLSSGWRFLRAGYHEYQAVLSAASGGLDKSLAYARHFPAIHWLTSYSELPE